MQQEILKSGLISKIVFIYVNGVGLKKREVVTLGYMDKKYCYFKSSNTLNFHKPKWRTKADIIAYTPEGVYETKVIIRDATYSQSEILFEVDIPKTWNFKQLRAGSRKKVELPLKIKFPDSVEIEGTTKEMSIGGFSILAKHNLTSVQKSFPSVCNIQFPKELLINFPDGQLETEVKYVRHKAITDEYDLDGYSVISFKFLKLTEDQKMVLKSYLMKL